MNVMFNKNDIANMIDRRVHRLKGIKVKSMVDSSMHRDDENRVVYGYMYKINPIRGVRDSYCDNDIYPRQSLYGDFPNSFSQTLRMDVSSTYLDKNQKKITGHYGVHAFYVILHLNFVDDTANDDVIAMRQKIRAFKLRGF